MSLLLIDVQHDFLPGGALAVTDGDKILPVVDRLIKRSSHIIASQDFHPPGHLSFATSHEMAVGEWTEVEGMLQLLWPDHCVQGSIGANLAINQEKIDYIVQKGTDHRFDSYSAFFDNAKRRSTGLHDYLQKEGVNDLTIAGLATDYCVKFTAIDAAELGYNVTVIREGCRGVNINPDDEKLAFEEMLDFGVEISSIFD